MPAHDQAPGWGDRDGGEWVKKWIDLLGAIWTGISTHKLRSFLTILGVVIGVAAVIILMSVGQGTSANILSSLEGLGSNLLFISPGGQVASGGGED